MRLLVLFVLCPIGSAISGRDRGRGRNEEGMEEGKGGNKQK